MLFAFSFIGTFYIMPRSIIKLREKGYVAKDMYKPVRQLIPTNSGIIIVFISYLSIAILPLIMRLLNQIFDINSDYSNFTDLHLAFLLVISIYSLYGLVDDLLDVGRKAKLFFPIIFGYPLIIVLSPEIITIPLIGDFDLTKEFSGDVTWSDVFRVTVIPIYVMVVSNLVNMHSGYNGLQSGLSIIVLSTLLCKSWTDGTISNVIPSGAFLGSMLALWWFNKYPSRVFEGNIGSLLFGSVIGCVIVIQEYWWFGFFILIPHTINFVQWCAWLVLIKKHPEKYLMNDGQHRKFGKVRSDNTIQVPNRLTLKWLPNYYWRLTEKQSTNANLIFTAVFCVTGLVIF